MVAPHSLTNVRRSWLERVLSTVRQLGSTNDFNETLNRITDAVVAVLEFGAAAINVTTPDGELRTEAVSGPEGITELLGRTTSLAVWQELIDQAEPWGSLRFFGHERDQTVFDEVEFWTPNVPISSEPGAWHPDDVLFVPLWTTDGALLGVLSVDQPRSGRRPDQEQQTVLELFAEQAASAIAESSARRTAEARQRDAESRWRLAFESSPLGAAIVRPDGHLELCNDALVDMFGYSREQLDEMTYTDLTHPDDVAEDYERFGEVLRGERNSYEVEKRYIHADGHVISAVLNVGVIRDEDGAATAIIGQVNDITARKEAEAQLARRATHDPLTDLPNRDLIEQTLAGYLAAGKPCGVLYCDLDRFKTINDSLGHDAGDELLQAAAARLRHAAPAGCTVGRVGGDEFVVLVGGQNDPARLRAVGEQIMAEFADRFVIRGHRHTVALSIGVTISGPWHEHPDEVLRQADQALLRAKRQGRARVEVYDPTQDKLATVEDLELEQALRTALAERHGLIAHYQPIIGIADNAIKGYEALVRWVHPKKGLLDPEQFLPLAEQTGLIVPLGWWMLAEGCRAAADPGLGDGGHWIAVNASGSQLGRGQLVGAITRALVEGAVPPSRLHLEITESELVDASPSAIREIREVADLGVHIALDDFGTGYSSLSLLRDLPVSTVKIDRSFVAPIAVDRNAMAIVRSVIGLCQELGVTTVAEGVETDDQLTTLRALGCNQAQGFLIGRPRPIEGAPRQRRRTRGGAPHAAPTKLRT